MKNYIKLLLSLTILATGSLSFAMEDFEVPGWTKDLMDEMTNEADRVMKEATDKNLSKQQKEEMERLRSEIQKERSDELKLMIDRTFKERQAQIQRESIRARIEAKIAKMKRILSRQ